MNGDGRKVNAVDRGKREKPSPRGGEGRNDRSYDKRGGRPKDRLPTEE